jgi:hypothetical protein
LWWLRWCEKRGNGKGKHWVHLFFRDNLNSGAYIILEELNQVPEQFKAFYLIRIERIS